MDIREAEEYAIALLACTIQPCSTPIFVGLVLRHAPGSYLYQVGAPIKGAGFVRYIAIDPGAASSKDFLGIEPDALPTYRWSVIYISEPVGGALSLPLQLSAPLKDSRKSRYLVIPGWTLSALREQGFTFTSAPHLPRLIRHTSTSDPSFIFTHKELSTQIRIHAGWCDLDKGLWVSVDFVDVDRYMVIQTEPTHTDNAADDAPCSLVHVQDWDRNVAFLPTRRQPADVGMDQSKLRWTQRREFVAMGRTVRLTLVDPGSHRLQDDSNDPRDELWILGMELVFPWNIHSLQVIPQPWARILPSGPSFRRSRWPSRAHEKDGFRCTYPVLFLHQPRTVNASQGCMFILFNRHRSEEVRVHVGWCDHDRGLWASVEFVDARTDGARCAEPVHDELSLAPERRLAGCPFPHVKDWALLADLANAPPGDFEWTTPPTESKLLARYRVFSVLNRAVRLRMSRGLSESSTGDERVASDDAWLLAVDFPLAWNTDIPAIPPPRRIELPVQEASDSLPTAPMFEETAASSLPKRPGRSWKCLVPKYLLPHHRAS